ncbi:unnamed protein product, partial [Ilex paraguariensis]
MEEGEHFGKDTTTNLGMDILLKATPDCGNLVQDFVAVNQASLEPMEEKQLPVTRNNAPIPTSIGVHSSMSPKGEDLEQIRRHKDELQNDNLIMHGEELCVSNQISLHFADSTYYMDHAFTCSKLSNVSLDEGLSLVYSKEPPNRGYYSDGDTPNNIQPVEVGSQGSDADDSYSSYLRNTVATHGM